MDVHISLPAFVLAVLLISASPWPAMALIFRRAALRGWGGAVTTVEQAEYKIGLAAANFARSGLAGLITQVHDDAGRVLRAAPDAAWDLVFLDSERPEYPGWWPDLDLGGARALGRFLGRPDQRLEFRNQLRELLPDTGHQIDA